MSRNTKILFLLLVGLIIALLGVIFLQESRDRPKGTSQTLAQERKPLYYRNPMQPEITSPVPAKDSMGMDYIAVYAEDEPKSPDPTSSPSIPPGRAPILLSPESQQRIGVTSTLVALKSLSHVIHAKGRVAFDPELYTAIEEYRQAAIAQKSLSTSSYSGMSDQSQSLLESSATKLKLLGLNDEQIRQLSRSPSSSINLLLPKGHVWVYAEVYEFEAGELTGELTIEAESPAVPGVTFRGKVASISPVLNTPTRTIRVRAEVPDPKGLLRPDTFLNVRIAKSQGQKLAVPEDAVLREDDKSYVFIMDKSDHFTPRQIQIGIKAQGYYEVLGGIKAGERVVTGANFLIDSESRLRSLITTPPETPVSGSHP